MASLMPQGKQQYFSATGAPLSGGKVYTYAAGTTTPLATYTDSAGGTPNANPVILDSRGEASIFFGGSSYKIVIKDSTDVTIWTQDNLAGDLLATLAASTGASLIGWIQSGTGAVATTVQTKLRESVSVKDFGAKGDGVTDDTAAVNAAITAVNTAGGGTVNFSAGTYVVNASGDTTGIQMKTGVYLNLNGAKLKATTSNATNYRIVNFASVTDCGINGGELIGERGSNSSGGQQGHGIYVLTSCSNITIQNMKIRDMHGDGIYLGKTCSNIRVLGSIVTNSYRNNISVVSSSNVVINACDISSANGVSPQNGIDVEPNTGDALSNNVIISNCNIYSNTGDGVAYPAPVGGPLIENSIISNCNIYSNGRYGVLASYVKELDVSNCIIRNNTSHGICDSAAVATRLNFNGNSIHDNGGNGITGFASNTTIIGNTIATSGGWGIYWQYGQQCSFANNIITDSAQSGIYYERAYNSTVSGNTVKNSQLHGIHISGTVTSSVTKSRQSSICGNTVYASSLATDNTYHGIFLDTYANNCTVTGNVVERATAGNMPLNAINAVDLTILIAGNITTTGAKAGNSQVVRAAVSPASFYNSFNFLTNTLAEKLFPGLTATAFITSGTGTPEGAQAAPVGSIWMRTDGGAGTSIYIKESGIGNTGWIAK